MSENTRSVVDELLKRVGAGDIEGVVELFARDAVWEIPGDPAIAPWAGHRSVKNIAEFFETISAHTDRERFDVERVVVNGPNAVLIGRARVVVRSTGKVIDTPFAIDIVVNPEGRISRYYMFEDSWRVAQGVIR
ncbi:nuclear transport factor 2 family protein [Streptomyces sp. NPDC055897]